MASPDRSPCGPWDWWADGRGTQLQPGRLRGRGAWCAGRGGGTPGAAPPGPTAAGAAALTRPRTRSADASAQRLAGRLLRLAGPIDRAPASDHELLAELEHPVGGQAVEARRVRRGFGH